VNRAKESEIPRVELDKWVWRLKEALDEVYGHDCDCVNSLEIIFETIALLTYKPSQEANTPDGCLYVARWKSIQENRARLAASCTPEIIAHYETLTKGTK
jgi:hypothetical protein